MKPAIILVIPLVLIAGCLTAQNGKATSTISGVQELVLNEQDLQQLGMASDGDCQTEEYQANADAPLTQYVMCNYTINSLNDTQLVLVLRNFANFEDLNGAYQYESLHLYSVEGIISENDYGDQSRFRVNNVNDYMGYLNDPNVYYYHLWICKDNYLIHITSGGSKEARGHIEKIGRRILSKFG